MNCYTVPGTVYTGPTLYSYRAHMGDGWGDNEIMIKHYQYDETRVWEYHSSGWSETELAVVNTPATIAPVIRVWERDSGLEPSGDDFWGEARMPASGVTVRVYGPCRDVYHDTNYWLSRDWTSMCPDDNPDVPIHTIDLVYRY